MKTDTEDQKRIKLLEYFGWTNLKREQYALKGTSPFGEERKIPPNPLRSLDVVHWMELEIVLDNKLYEKLLSIAHCEKYGDWNYWRADTETRVDCLIRLLELENGIKD